MCSDSLDDELEDYLFDDTPKLLSEDEPVVHTTSNITSKKKRSVEDHVVEANHGTSTRSESLNHLFNTLMYPDPNRKPSNYYKEGCKRPNVNQYGVPHVKEDVNTYRGLFPPEDLFLSNDPKDHGLVPRRGKYSTDKQMPPRERHIIEMLDIPEGEEWDLNQIVKGIQYRCSMDPETIPSFEVLRLACPIDPLNLDNMFFQDIKRWIDFPHLPEEERYLPEGFYFSDPYETYDKGYGSKKGIRIPVLIQELRLRIHCKYGHDDSPYPSNAPRTSKEGRDYLVWCRIKLKSKNIQVPCVIYLSNVIRKTSWLLDGLLF